MPSVVCENKKAAQKGGSEINHIQLVKLFYYCELFCAYILSVVHYHEVVARR